MFKPQHYRGLSILPLGVAHVDSELRKPDSIKLPERILRLAQTEYEIQQGTNQDYERIQQRGGLSVLEIILLLSDYVERLGGVPTTPRLKQVKD